MPAEKVGNEYWLLVPGKPASVQARTRPAKARRTRFMNLVKTEAQPVFNHRIRRGVEISLYHFHKGTDIDLDNIQKPILDALTGIAYNDDDQVEHIDSRRVHLNSSNMIRNVTTTLVPQALADKKECVVICIKPVT